MRLPKPMNFFGNLVLWAHPKARAGELVRSGHTYAVQVIRNAVSQVDNGYFKSFIDYMVLLTWLFLRSMWVNLPVEGLMVFFLPSYKDKGGVNFLHVSFLGACGGAQEEKFKRICYRLD